MKGHLYAILFSNGTVKIGRGKNHPISTLYDSEPALREDLVLAARLRDTGGINSITDQLAKIGLCRQRGDTSRLAELPSQCANRRAPA